MTFIDPSSQLDRESSKTIIITFFASFLFFFFFFSPGFLGQAVCKRAVLEGYLVTSISRRGRPPGDQKGSSSSSNISYRQGDCRDANTISEILQEGGYTGNVEFLK